MKADKSEEKKAVPVMDTSLQKYVGKNLSEKKTNALIENLEQIKAALQRHSKVQTN